jgi:hypothetical protein
VKAPPDCATRRLRFDARMRRAMALGLGLSLGLLACSEKATDEQAKETVESARAFSGVWLYEFEGSTFLENETEIPDREVDRQQAAWLDYHPESLERGTDYDAYDEQQGCYPRHAYKVEFIGRRVIPAMAHYPNGLPAGAGHLGLWGSEIIVERMISATPLQSQVC